MTKTSAATNSKRRCARAGGFSLVEVMIAIALVALITAVAVPAFNAVFRTSTEAFTRKLATMLREARDRALLTDKLIRLRLDLDKQEYWVEEAPSNYLLPKNTETKRFASEREKEEAEKKEASTFQIVKSLTKDKQAIPKGIKLVEVITPRKKDPVSEGMLDVYFFNNGSADAAILHFEDEEKIKRSLLLHPVTGQSKVRDGFLKEDEG